MKAQEAHSATEVVDVCLINNESLLAQLRCDYLSGVVSSHIFVEANVTHSGQPRQTSISSLWSTGIPDNVNIVELVVPEEVLQQGDRWAIEEFSRQWAVRYAQKLFPRAALLVCDIDELPSREQVGNVAGALKEFPIVTLPMFVSYQYVNWFARGRKAFWTKAKAIRPTFLDPGFRFRRAPHVPGSPGQHFRYLGFSGEMISRKHEDFAHEELDLDTAHDSRLAWSKRFQLTTVPEFDRLGSGILTVEKCEALPDSARFALSQYPDLVGSVTGSEPLTRRFVASYLAQKNYAYEKTFDFPTLETRLGKLNSLLWAVCAKIPHSLGLSLIKRILLRLPRMQTRRRGSKIIDVLRGVNKYGAWDSLEDSRLDI